MRLDTPEFGTSPAPSSESASIHITIAATHGFLSPEILRQRDRARVSDGAGPGGGDGAGEGEVRPDPAQPAGAKRVRHAEARRGRPTVCAHCA